MTNGVSIKGKVCLVTGSNRSIGLAILEALVEKGAKKVYAAVRNLETAIPLASKYDTVVPLHLDLSDPKSIQEAAKSASDVEIVVNNAGVLSRTFPLADNAIDELQTEMNINVYGLMHIAREFAPVLKQNGGGVLVQLNSVGSIRCSAPSVSTYCASKHASFAMTQALRMELKQQNTLVVSVHPGPIMTDMLSTSPELSALEPEDPKVVGEAICQSIEAGEFLCYPDKKAKSLGKAYAGYADHVFEKGNSY